MVRYESQLKPLDVRVEQFFHAAVRKLGKKRHKCGEEFGLGVNEWGLNSNPKDRFWYKTPPTPLRRTLPERFTAKNGG